MRIKDHSQFTKWQFWITLPDGSEHCIPSESEFCDSFGQLYSLVSGQIFQLPQQYQEAVAFNASKMGLTPEAYIRAAIEHQICLREEDPNSVCWQGGLGDQLHSVAGKLDGLIESSPPGVKEVAQAAVQLATMFATGHPAKKLGDCGTCGGTTVFNPFVQALGRAGVLNNLAPANTNVPNSLPPRNQ